MKVGLFVGDVIPGETLGVARYALGMAQGLSEIPEVELTVLGIDEAVAQYELVATSTPHDLSDLDVVIKIHQLQSEQFDLPTITVFHDLHPLDVPWKYGAGLKTLLRRIDKNVAASAAIVSEFPYTVTRVQDRYPDAASRVFDIPSPTLLDTFVPPARPSTPVPAGTFILYPSQFQLHKNHWTLLDALPQLREIYPDMELVLPGSFFRPYMKERILDRALQLDLKDKVHLLGHVSEAELVYLYRACSIVVSPSLAEGGAYLAQEALLMGRPVALAALPSARAHLDKMGLRPELFDAMDASSLTTAVDTSLKTWSDTVTQGHVSAARAKVSSWTWESVGSALVSHVNDLLTSPTTTR